MKKLLEKYESYLNAEEKSKSTIEKYIHDIKRFIDYTGGRELVKQLVVDYKDSLAQKYSVSTVNGAIAAMNGFFDFIGRPELRVKPLKKQKNIFCREEKELSKAEYNRLLCAAEREGNRRLKLIIETICSTGIRVSELKYITAEAVKNGQADVNCKGKRRIIFMPKRLKNLLSEYIRQRGIKSGPVFVTKSGKAVSRGNIWRDMKKLCDDAGVEKSKVFPHNLRHLFAREFYRIEKDIAKLADLLGHANVETTRIYIMETGEEHRKILERMGLVYQ